MAAPQVSLWELPVTLCETGVQRKVESWQCPHCPAKRGADPGLLLGDGWPIQAGGVPSLPGR